VTVATERTTKVNRESERERKKERKKERKREKFGFMMGFACQNQSLCCVFYYFLKI
jgi:hypothetical protein